MSKKKQVCVIGLGHFGWELACALASHCEVLAIDQSPELVTEIADKVHRALALDVRDEAALASAIPEGLDEAIISMGENLEASILCTLYLKRLGIPIIRVKALNDDHAVILRQLGATEVIFPERETARRVAAHILHPNLLDFVPVAGDYQVVKAELPPGFYGHTLGELKLRGRFGVTVIAVERPGSGTLEFLPGPDFKLERGDLVIMIGREQDLEKLQESEGP